MAERVQPLCPIVPDLEEVAVNLKEYDQLLSGEVCCEPA